jgi:NitT/TauT family transport system substrate-binding protein
MNLTKLLRLGLVVAAVSVFMIACSSDDDGGDASEPTAAATEATGAAEPLEPDGGPTIKLGFSTWPGWLPWQVTEEMGFFEAAGVDVELVWFEGYLDSINAFAAGQLDGNSQTLSDTLLSVAAGSDQRIVLTNDNSTGNDQIIVDASIGSIQDLVGKEIGVEAGVVDHFLLALGLEEQGLSLDDVTIVNLETGAAASAFSAGQLDAVGVFAPFTTVALGRAGSKTLFTSADFPGSIPDHLAVSGALVEERPEAVQRIINAWYMTLDYINNNPAEAVAIMAERAGVSVEDYEEYDAGTTLFSVADAVAAYSPGEDFTHLDFAAREIAAFLLETGFVEGEIDLGKVLDPQFTIAYADEMS